MAFGNGKLKQLTEAPKQAVVIATIALVIAGLALIVAASGGARNGS